MNHKIILPFIKDINAKAVKFLYAFRLTLWSIFPTQIMKLYCNFTGIEIGSNNTFYGFATILRNPKSKIRIGNRCRFRSKSLSNLIGINHRCIIITHHSDATIEIGDGCGFSGTVISSFCKIKIGKNVLCGANTLISDGDWHPKDERVGNAKSIIIDDNVWLGYGAIVMKGVTIGKNSIIGVGSIVTKDIPPNVIAAGNPCKVLKEINSFESK